MDDRAVPLFRRQFISAVALPTIFAPTALQGCCRGTTGDRAAHNFWTANRSGEVVNENRIVGNHSRLPIQTMRQAGTPALPFSLLRAV
jgi:hypothetical protein